MPNKNGMGPEGKGPKTGRGLGPCSGDNSQGNVNGKGRGVGRQHGRGLRQNSNNETK
jgi:hypothetical protein